MSDDIEQFLSSLPSQVQGIARGLRARVRDVVPNAVERWHGGWKVLGYSSDGSMKSSICAIAPHSNHVNLQFLRGTELDDPDALLVGTGKSVRHVKLHDVSDVQESGVERLLRQAAGLAQSG